jgi:hypothetical protein
VIDEEEEYVQKYHHRTVERVVDKRHKHGVLKNLVRMLVQLQEQSQ